MFNWLGNSREEEATGSEVDYGRVPIDEFDSTENWEPKDVEGDKEISIEDRGEVYAGSWVRDMFENARECPTQPTWVGYEEARTPIEGAREVSVLYEQLDQHLGVFGGTGNGKSTLLLNMMVQWAYAGRGFCFIDPKGKDAYKLVRMLPEERLDDVYWVEPGSIDHDKVIGINFLHTNSDPGDPEFSGEASAVVSDLVTILQTTRTGWGAAMESVVKNVARRMLVDDEDYSILDLYTLLSNDEYRESLPEYYEGNPKLKPRAEHIAQKDSEEISPLLRRFQDFAEERARREAIAHRQSDIDVKELVDNDKIIIVRMRERMDEDASRLVGSAIMRRVWSAVSSRQVANPRNFHLVVDEFHKVMGQAANIESMLSTGRTFGLSVTISTQQPSQLEEMKDALGNVKNFISFDPGDKGDARFISSRLDMEPEKLLRLPQYMAYCNVRIGEKEMSGPVRTNTFPPYPYLRSEEEAKRVVDQIVEKYGKEQMREGHDTSTLQRNPLEKGKDGEDEGETVEMYEMTTSGEEMSERDVLECIFDAQLESGGPEAWTDRETIKQKVALELGVEEDVVSDTKVANVVTEKIPQSYIQRDIGEKVYVSLAPAGRDRIFWPDSGGGGSAGSFSHRVLLSKSYLTFRTLGYDVEIPKQDGDELPDAIATPPINPNQDGLTFSEAQELADELEEKYPRLFELFGTDELHLEPESKSLTKPKQPFKNLIKAMKKDRHCVFVVRDGRDEGNNLEANAEKIHTWIEDKRFAKRYDGADREFYNFSKTFDLDGATPLVKEPGGNQKWVEDGKRILLKDPEGGEPLVEFSSIDSFKNPTTTDFPHYLRRNRAKGVTELYRGDGTKIRDYKNKDLVLSEGFKEVRKPFVPEVELPEWPLPNDWNGYSIVIIPGMDSEESPYIYQDGEAVPVFRREDRVETVNKVESEFDGGQEEDENNQGESGNESEQEESDKQKERVDNLDRVIAEEAHESQAEVRDERDGEDIMDDPLF